MDGSKRQRDNRQRSDQLRLIATVFVSMLIIGVVNIGLSYAIVKYSERKWCGLISTLVDGYTAPSTTPPTDRGRKIAADLADLRRSFGCG